MVDRQELIDCDRRPGGIGGVVKDNAEGNVFMLGSTVTDDPPFERIVVDLNQHNGALRRGEVLERRADQRGRSQVRVDRVAGKHQLEHVADAALGARTIRSEVDNCWVKQLRKFTRRSRQLADRLPLGRMDRDGNGGGLIISRAVRRSEPRFGFAQVVGIGLRAVTVGNGLVEVEQAGTRRMFALIPRDRRPVVVERDERILAADQVDLDRRTDLVAITVGDCRRELQAERIGPSKVEEDLLVKHRRVFRPAVIDRKELVDRDMRGRRIAGVHQRDAESDVFVTAIGNAVRNNPALDRGVVDLNQHDGSRGCVETCERSTGKCRCRQVGADGLARQHQLQDVADATVRAGTVRSEIDQRRWKEIDESARRRRQFPDRLGLRRRGRDRDGGHSGVVESAVGCDAVRFRFAGVVTIGQRTVFMADRLVQVQQADGRQFAALAARDRRTVVEKGYAE